MFWCRHKFELETYNSLPIRDLFSDTKDYKEWSSMTEVNNFIQSHKDLRSQIREKVGSILQYAQLKVKFLPRYDRNTSKYESIIVANTHLFFHPLADHIRAIQSLAICHKLEELRRDGTFVKPFLLCGDLNSDPKSGAIKLLLERKLSAKDDSTGCWKNVDHYKWDDKNENENTVLIDNHDDTHTHDDSEKGLMPPTLALPPSFPVMFAGYEEFPLFTNYCPNFQETLDYIIASKATEESKGFKLVDSAEMPSKEDIQQYISMPNKNMPSDHVSIICDLKIE